MLTFPHFISCKLLMREKQGTLHRRSWHTWQGYAASDVKLKLIICIHSGDGAKGEKDA